MNICKNSIKTTVIKAINNKPYFKLNDKGDFIKIVQTGKLVSDKVAFKVAEGLASNLNNALNSKYKLGEIFFAKMYSDVIGVDIVINDALLNKFNAQIKAKDKISIKPKPPINIIGVNQFEVEGVIYGTYEDAKAAAENSDDTYGFGETNLEQVLNDAIGTKHNVDKLLLEARAQLEKLVAINKKTKNLNSEIKKDLHSVLTLLRSPEDFGKIKTMATYFVEINVLTEHFKKRIKNANTITNDISKAAELLYLKQIAVSFKPFLKDITSEFRDLPEDNLFRKTLKDTISNIDTIEAIYEADIFESVLGTLTEELDPIVKNLMKELEDEIIYLENRVKIAGARGDDKRKKNLLDKIEAIKKKKMSLIPNKNTIENYLKGDMGDANYFSMYLEDTIASGNPLVSGFAKIVHDALALMRIKVQPIKHDLQILLDDYMKQTGRTPGDNAKFFEDLYEEIEIGAYDDDGNYTPQKTFALIGQYNQSFKNKEQSFRYRIETERNKGNYDESQKIIKEYREWLNKYAERKYTDAYYDVYDLLSDDAKQAQDAIITEINKIKNGPNKYNLTEKEEEELDNLYFKLKNLSQYTYTDTGLRKTGTDLEITKSIREFKAAMRSVRNLTITERGQKAFEDALMKKKNLLKKGEITQEQFDKWYRRNTKTTYKQEFYDERARILDSIEVILNKLPKDFFGSKENITELWENLVSIGNLNRDEDGIINGSELTEEEFKKAKEYEEKRDELFDDLLSLTGLSKNQQKRLNELFDLGPEKTENEKNELAVLLATSRKNKSDIHKYLTKVEVEHIFYLRKQLKNIQEKLPTKYYYERFDAEFDKYTKNLTGTYDEKLELFKQSEWYQNNHRQVEKTIVSPQGDYYTDIIFEPLYIWTQIVPLNEDYIEHETPGFQYMEYVVNPDYVNNHYVDIDENGGYHKAKQFIIENGKATESPYVNQKYEELKQNTLRGDLKAAAKFNLLNFLTKTYLDSQKKIGVGAATKLGLVLPSIEKDWYDRFSDDKKSLKDKVKSTLHRRFIINEQDADLSLGDMSGIEFKYLPVKYTGKISIDDISLNLVESIMKFYLMAEEYEVKEELKPFAEGLINVLQQPKNKVGNNTFDAVLNRIGLQRTVKKEGQSNTEKQINEFFRTVFYGEEVKDEQWLGKNTAKYVDNLMSLSALQMMALNIPSHIVNIMSGEAQSLIESAANKYSSISTYTKAKQIYFENIVNFFQDYKKEGGHSLLTQLAFMYNVPQGEALDKFGEKSDWTNVREGFGWLYLTKNAGEHEIQMSMFISMLLHKKVKINGIEKSLYDAYELKDGKVQLKDGVEFNENDFKLFNGQVYTAVRDLNGNYGKLGRPLIEKYSLGRLTTFMRKYMVPMIARRFDGLHVDMNSGTFKEGYYITFWNSLAKDIIKLQLDIATNWGDYTESQKQAIRRVLTEISIIVAVYILLALLGEYDDDRDYKLDEKGLARLGYTKFWKNHLLYLLMRFKSETENFIPVIGFQELYNQVSTPTIALKTLGNLLQIGEQAAYLITGNDSAFYKRNYGIWEKDDWKIFAKLGKVVGFTGNWLYPEMNITNFKNAQRIR
jgi:hypothetical protein